MLAVREQLNRDGFAFIRSVYSTRELDAIIDLMEGRDDVVGATTRSADTYAIRRAMRTVPELGGVVWTSAMKELVRELVGLNAFVTKSLWFDKPPGGNWFVGYHQDISISVDQRVDVKDYGRWTSKHGIIGVVPPAEVLENVLTFRLHLDDADQSNGALKVKPGTHRHGITRNTAIEVQEIECPLRAGDVMLMRPLLLHSSMRSMTAKPRRVLHIEVSRTELAPPLAWAERQAIE